MLALARIPDWKPASDPGKRNVGMQPPELLQHGTRQIGVTRHAGGGGDHTIGGDKVVTLPDALAEQPDRLAIVTLDIRCVARNGIVDCGEWITRAELYCAVGRRRALAPTPAPCQD